MVNQPKIPFEELNRKEKEIVRVLNATRRPMNTNQIAERSDMSWQTAKKWLEELHSKKYVIYRSESGGTYWRLR